MQTTATTVVVVDDEVDVLDLICSVLEDEGYDVICLRHPGEIAHLKGREPQPRLFMLDIMLPGMTGIELAQHLRSDGFGETPMIAMSASATMLHRAEESQLFHDALPKPFDLDALLDAVDQQLKAA
jgi:CheY-like chemotaxis protein